MLILYKVAKRFGAQFFSLPCVKGGGARKRDGGIVKNKFHHKTIPQSNDLRI